MLTVNLIFSRCPILKCSLTRNRSKAIFFSLFIQTISMAELGTQWILLCCLLCKTFMLLSQLAFPIFTVSFYTCWVDAADNCVTFTDMQTYCFQASIKTCDPEYGKIGVQATGLVLSCLLKSGMSSPVAEVRAIRSVNSLNTLIWLYKYVIQCEVGGLYKWPPSQAFIISKTCTAIEPVLCKIRFLTKFE